MNAEDAEKQRRKRRKRRWVKRVAIGIPVAAVLYVVGCLLYVGLVVSDPGRVARHAYNFWLTENREAYGSFKELARENGWKMYVWTDNGLGVLDLGRSNYKPLYPAKHGRRIYIASNSCGGRIAFIDCREKSGLFRSRVDRSDFAVGILGADGSLAKVPLEGTIRSLGVGPIALSEDHAFFGCGSAAYLYEIESKRLHTAFEPPPEWRDHWVIKAGIVEGEFLVLLMEDSRPERVVVLEPEKPFRQLSKMDGVSNVLTVGEKIVIEKGEAVSASDRFIGKYVAAWGEGACFLYDPDGETTERLTGGHLVCSCRDDEFLFCTLDQGYTSEGRGRLYRYTIHSRSKELVWEPRTGDTGFATRPGEEKQYDYTKLFLSPDGRFLFIPWHVPPRSHAELHLARMLEYEVYDLTTGKKRGAFVDSFEGGFFFSCLGWDTTGRETGLKEA